MSWREWVAEMEERVELLRREAESGDGRHVEALSITQDRNLPRLIKGLRLCAEAVEAVEGGVGKVCADCGEIGECADWCSVRKALEWLRGVGK